MLTRTVFCFFSFFSFLLSAGIEQGQNFQGPAPSWVRAYDFPFENISVKPSQVNLQFLLIDSQRNVEEVALYRHFAIRVLSQSGVETVSQVKVDFDPSYTKVMMHNIRIFRDGQWMDRLENARHNILQREEELEKNLYNGGLTLVYFLDDIREGDIVEYAYSKVGDNPLASSCFVDCIYMQRNSSVEKITHRVVASPNLVFSIKPVNTQIEPRINDLNPTMKEWIWEATETAPYSEEEGQPSWFNPPAHIRMSQYQSWKDVVANILPLYNLPADFFVSIPSEMRDIITTWEGCTHDLKSRALLALRFVQDEIRYQGFEEGMGAFQPTDPRTTFQRRFGDCKDKTFLLHSLLKLMGIPSKMLLVHTERGRQLPDMLPTPFVFNHIVLQFDIAGKSYWVDPTWTLQGGDLENNFFPDYYEWGLLLCENTLGLTSLPKPVFQNPTEIDSVITIETEDSARLRIKSTLYGSKADRLRRFLNWQGLEKISERSLNRIQEFYGTASVYDPIEVFDNREDNIITYVESYKIPTMKSSSETEVELFSYTLENYLYTHINPQRTSPCEISYPLWVREKILVKNPFIQWTPYENNYRKEHESMTYNRFMRIEKNTAFFSYELKHLSDQIPKESLYDYWQITQEIQRKGFPVMVVAKKKPRPVNFIFISSVIGLFMWVVFNVFSKKKRPTQDWLTFYLRKFIFYYVIINGLIFCSISPNFGPIFLAASIFASLWVMIRVFTKRTVGFLNKLDVFLIFKTGVLISLLFLVPLNLHLAQKILALGTYCFYIGTCLVNLYKAKLYLLEEKRLEKPKI